MIKILHNLMDVYLDAVFHPNIYKKEEIFRQEGWHYELEDPEMHRLPSMEWYTMR